MSTMVEFIIEDPRTVKGLHEEVSSWGGENLSFEPPRYAYDGLTFTLVPVAQHVRAALPASFASTHYCLELAEATVLVWERGALPVPTKGALRAFIQAVAGSFEQWAAVYDPSSGPLASSNVSSQEVFDRLASAVEGVRPTKGAEILLVR